MVYFNYQRWSYCSKSDLEENTTSNRVDGKVDVDQRCISEILQMAELVFGGRCVG